ncbi:antigen 5 like allergen Cul n 1 [Drosophila grimshawi]|uniref:GH16558 n=1 Tax=Drosophila grimshawi TaxID=7222 RepID=B4J1M7_DROGR|nr:antigen 5 like allergen Cul n 1 [Drosophila grimshawi]EDV96947.1 GH16558 [Drosophila grimshawi]
MHQCCKHLLATVSLLLLQQVYCQNETTNYCQTGLCPTLKKHIACKAKVGMSKVCPSAQQLNLTQHQPLILTQHNLQRNVLASGKLENFKMPEKMATIQWNEELQQLAQLNVMQCELHYDQCHNTLEFRNSGQNVAMQNASDRTDEDLIKDSIDRWWDQYKNITREQVEHFPKEPKVFESFRNFAVMARDNNTHVGCAATRYTKGQAQLFLMACNYASNFIPDRALYRPKSLNCQNGFDRTYLALCKIGEQYRDIEPLEPNK